MSVRLSRRAKRIMRRHQRKPSVVPLNLVSMIDVFTVLVFFLLVTTNNIDALRNPRELALPSSLSTDQPSIQAPLITITKQAILVQGAQVMTLDEAMASPAGKPLDPIRSRLLQVGIVQVAGADAGKTTRGEINVMADKDTPYAVLQKVLATCGSNKFARIAISVAHSSKAGR